MKDKLFKAFLVGLIDQRDFNLNVIENNLKVYVDRISQEQLPNSIRTCSEIISDMERLRKETPSEFKESNKKLIAALKTQKRKLLSDTLREIRRSGLKLSSRSDILAKISHLIKFS